MWDPLIFPFILVTSSSIPSTEPWYPLQAPTSESYDSVRQNIVILLGTLARHLDKTDPKVKPIVKKLTETLSTPSQAVSDFEVASE